MNWILINLLLSTFMMGVIWVIQLVHYPSFRFIDRSNWARAHNNHVRGISLIVAPVMIAEIVCRFYLCFHQTNVASISATILLIIIWLSTFNIQVPLHNKLEQAWTLDVVNQLINSNWIRTLLWTINTGILLIGYTRDLW